MYEKQGRNENEKTKRDEAAEGARKEAADSRMQDGGFTWLESTRRPTVLNFFITGSCTRQIISGVVYAEI